MQTSHDPAIGFGVIILNKCCGQSQRLELVRTIGFTEEAATILKDIRYQDNYVVEMPGSDLKPIRHIFAWL